MKLEAFSALDPTSPGAQVVVLCIGQPCQATKLANVMKAAALQHYVMRLWGKRPSFGAFSSSIETPEFDQTPEWMLVHVSRISAKARHAMVTLRSRGCY